ELGPAHLAGIIYREFVHRIERREEAAKKDGNYQESQSTEHSSIMIVALLFASVACVHFQIDQLEEKRLFEVKIHQAAPASQENKPWTADLKPSKIPQQELIAWVEQQTAAILHLVVERLAPYLQPSSEDLQPVQLEMQPVKSFRGVAPVLQMQQEQLINTEDAATFAARERELKIREKELQMKEEIFERQTEAYKLKMEEFRAKFDDLEERAVTIEAVKDTDHQKLRMAVMSIR
ncbi:hypothetical protein PENTCL1PPCAC_8370, partial [Pristionchus entomophagus]